MSFIEVQNEFMAHIRQPQQNKKPSGIEDRRMAIYRDLFFNNVDGFISSGFPVLKTLYSEKQWKKLIRQFFSNHDCHSPYFLDIAGEFINYLASDYKMQKNDPAFMLELAHYEWIELDVSIAMDDPQEQKLNATDITHLPMYLSVAARNLSYQYPVQTISVDFQPKHPAEQPSYFVVYRDAQDDVQFLATNAMTALLLSIIENSNGITFDEICEQVLNHAPQFSPEQINQGALATLNAMAERRVIVTKNQD
ncbi:HvfC family RiPP maturation protein [Pseudoalteromonas carrageenovora]|uniref:HvfC family RiPP maturation protein n=1 Tax=Pseudoalteromonas carrageenovora TaxID=227 RepID=UPI0026E301F6|nr:putative DNA-binding domain-containing protein [Pseudoalteromonas carrageenovora]MDO6545659.1 putative DNA-binding domain-containing protein [Pseudoalteromonas carrageenovora]MDO6830414.1 putative DNA-binding domain-containing protein [Pseudoalteromonas carrageenovora]